MTYNYADAWHPILKQFVSVDISKLHQLTKGRKPVYIKLAEIWGGNKDSPDFSEERLRKADVRYPILLDTYTEGVGFKGGLVDGRHRKIKLMRAGKTHAPVIFLTTNDINVSRIKTNEVCITLNKQLIINIFKALKSR